MGFRAFLTGNDGTTDTTQQPITFTVPSSPTVQVGDVAVAIMSINSAGANAFVPPSGWTLRSAANPDQNNSAGMDTVIYTKTLTSTEVGHPVVFQGDYAGRTVGGMMIHSGVTEASIVIDTNLRTGNSNTTVPFGAPTTGATPAVWDVGTIAIFRRAATPAATVATTPSGWTFDGTSQTHYGGSPEFAAIGFHLTAGGANSTTYGSGVSAAMSAAGFSNTYTYGFGVASTSYVKSIPETSTSTDAASASQGLARSQGEVSTSTDASQAVQGLLRAQNDASTSTDAAGISQGRASGEVSTSTDAFSFTQALARTIGEVSSLTDNVSAQIVRAEINDFNFVIPVLPWTPFGHGQTIEVKQFDPGSFSVNSQDEDSPAGDYVLFGTDRHSPPTWAFQMFTNVYSVGDARAWYEQFKQVWNNPVRFGPGGVLPLRYRLDGKIRRVYGRPRKLGPNFDKIQFGKIYLTADFRLTEDVYYDDDDHSVTVGIKPGALVGGTGVVLPQPLPWHFTTTPAPRTAQAVVDGSAKTWLTITIHGPVTNPTVQIGTTTYALTGTIPLGTNVRLSGRPWEGGVLLYTSSPATGLYRPDMLDPRARLSTLQVDPGVWYAVTYTGFDNTGSSTCDVTWATAHESF